jgi:23S rRNA (adenine2503-C2)-methyltransferase
MMVDVISTDMRTALQELDRDDLATALAARGVPRFRSRQIVHWIDRRGVTDFHAMTNLPKQLREELAASFELTLPAVESRHRSEDGTTKFLLGLADGARIEAVYIPDTPAQTFCISTQVGCAMACGFCLTGRMGLVRHLTAGEIAGQVRVLARETGLAGTPFNIVLMGMGEPLHNYDATMKALRIVANPDGLAVHPRRITLSTVGLVPALARLAREPIMPNVAISLHATTNESRDRLVPINRKYDLAALIAACRALPATRQRRLTFEYVLLAGVNDTPADARRLATLLQGLKAKVNLLPLNAAPSIPFERPSDERVSAFAKSLADRGLIVSVRRSRGRDIRAACGQLIVEGQRPTPAQTLAGTMNEDAGR